MTWRPIVDGYYEVSDNGRIRRARPGKNTVVGRELTRTKMTNGYLKVSPVVAGKNVLMYVHDLVAAAFIGPKPLGACVNHIDGDKSNNRVANLEYVSHTENMAHAARTGLMRRGERHGRAKLSDAQVVELRGRRAGGEGVRALAKCFGVSAASVSEIANGKRRTA